MTDFDIYIVDDGTLDTVVSFQDTLFRFDSEYRFSFDSDKAFLLEVKEDLVTQMDDAWENNWKLTRLFNPSVVKYLRTTLGFK